LNEFINELNKTYGNWGKILSINNFMLEVRKNLTDHGLEKHNSRLVFSVCPDDVNRIDEVDSVENALTSNYNGEFHLGGLGAYPMGGVSGITAASHHSPDNKSNGEKKHGNLIFFISPHVGLIKNQQGEYIYGKLARPGQQNLTSSCGAMMGFLAALKQAGSPEDFKIAPDNSNTDPTRMVLHGELINNYAPRLSDILAIEDENLQVVNLFKLNYDLVMNKANQMINEFLMKEKEHFKGDIAKISGITVNLGSQDIFIMKDISYPRN